MTIAAAVDIVAEDQEAVIAAAAKFARQRGEPCFAISVIRTLREAQREIVEHNLTLITARNASPVLLQDESGVAATLASAAKKFGIGTLFVKNGRRRFGRSLAEQLVRLRPAFEVVVIHSPMGE